MVEVYETLEVDSLISLLGELRNTGASNVVAKYGSIEAAHVMQIKQVEIDKAGRIVIVVE